MPKNASQTAPNHLAAPTRSWFNAVISAYTLKEHHIRLLTLAGEAWDRCAQAREQLAREGLTVVGREGTKVHPCVAVERDARAAFAHLIKQLGLDDFDAPRRGPGRPGMPVGISYDQLEGMPWQRQHNKPGRRTRKNAT